MTKSETQILGGRGSADALKAKIRSLRTAIERTQNQYERERLQQRLANLSGNIATVSVGGTTQVDIEERRYSAASAMFSVRAAIEFGYSYGGGIALLNVRPAVATLTHKTEAEKAGAVVVYEALAVPFLTLASGRQKNGLALLQERQSLSDPAKGFNVESGSLENLGSKGILDPTKTLSSAIGVAWFHARAILKTDVWSVSPLADDGESPQHP